GPAFLTEKMPYREGQAAVLQPGGLQNRLQVADSPDLPTSTFTVEAFVLLRSVYDDASVRTIAAHWGGNKMRPGWSFGVTSTRSARWARRGRGSPSAATTTSRCGRGTA